MPEQGFLGRVKSFFGGLRQRLGGGTPTPPPTPSPTPPSPPPPPIVERPPPVLPPKQHIPEREEFEELDNDPHYIGKHGRVLPRWKLGDEGTPPGGEGLRRMIADARSGRRKLTFVVTGIYSDDYPGKDTAVITLSYSFGTHIASSTLERGNYETAQEWINAMLEGRGESWDDVHSIDIVDR